MTRLLVASPAPLSGKTAFIAGLALHLRRAGLKVGYFKPVAVPKKRADGQTLDTDPIFIRAALSLSESEGQLAPVGYQPVDWEDYVANPGQVVNLVREALGQVEAGKDVVLMEAAEDLPTGASLELSAAEVAAGFDAAVILVLRYQGVPSVDQAVFYGRQFGDRLKGVVFNAVPPERADFVEQKLRPVLAGHGLPWLGWVPQARFMLALTVNEIAKILGGRIITAQEKADELVENLMMATVTPDASQNYFARKPNKAVIAAADRPDIHLAALETPTRALILTGNWVPDPIVVARAEEDGVPIVLVPSGTLATIEALEAAYGSGKFTQAAKVNPFARLMSEHLDIDRLIQLARGS
jgi:BioD-like phosphotransacetylase family protein